MSFSQNWARYSAVRDGLPAFEGHVYVGEYLRSQYDPARDRARLKSPGAMVASEGVAASVLFWIADGHARSNGARPHAGLDQPGLLDAELRLLRGFGQAARTSSDRPVDLCDVVAAQGAAGSDDRRHAIERFVAITRGATAAPLVRAQWQQMYSGAISLDLQAARRLSGELDVARAAAVKEALKDPDRLRALLGPVLPIRIERAKLHLTALGGPFPAEFDLDSMGMPELSLLTEDGALRQSIARQLDERPFQSFADFETRSGVRLAALGATPVEPEGRKPARR